MRGWGRVEGRDRVGWDGEGGGGTFGEGTHSKWTRALRPEVCADIFSKSFRTNSVCGEVMVEANR